VGARFSSRQIAGLCGLFGSFFAGFAVELAVQARPDYEPYPGLKFWVAVALLGIVGTLGITAGRARVARPCSRS
jgi:hypothetical protein